MTRLSSMMKALSNHDEFSCHELKYSHSTTTYDVGSLCRCFTADVLRFWLAVCSAVSENRKTVAVEQRQNQPKVKLQSARHDSVLDSEPSNPPKAC